MTKFGVTHFGGNSFPNGSFGYALLSATKNKKDETVLYNKFKEFGFTLIKKAKTNVLYDSSNNGFKVGEYYTVGAKFINSEEMKDCFYYKADFGECVKYNDESIFEHLGVYDGKDNTDGVLRALGVEKHFFKRFSFGKPVKSKSIELYHMEVYHVSKAVRDDDLEGYKKYYCQKIIFDLKSGNKDIGFEFIAKIENIKPETIPDIMKFLEFGLTLAKIPYHDDYALSEKLDIDEKNKISDGIYFRNPKIDGEIVAVDVHNTVRDNFNDAIFKLDPNIAEVTNKDNSTYLGHLNMKKKVEISESDGGKPRRKTRRNKRKVNRRKSKTRTYKAL